MNLAQINLKDFYALSGYNSLGEAVRSLIAPFFSVVATAIVFYFLIGAFKYIASQGDKNAIHDARNMITYAIVGFGILIFAFFIVGFLSEYFGLPDVIGQ